MADKKISALTAASTPLAGTEVLPIVQSGATVKVAVSDLTDGRAISATEITLTTGNVIVTNGQGVNFSATPGTGTSELFADYEEGTFTAAITPATSGTVTLSSSIDLLAYTKIGRVVFVQGLLEVSSVSLPVGTSVSITNLPFTTATLTEYAGRSGGAFFVDLLISTSGAKPLRIFEGVTFCSVVLDASLITTGTQFYVQFSYIAA
jgi:hypothetical protein